MLLCDKTVTQWKPKFIILNGMLTSFFVIHRRTQEKFSADLLAECEGVLWQTCLRQIVFGRNSDEASRLLQAGDDLFVGEQAYQFVLEVICGLHSPMVGETEVLGQFRTLFKDVARSSVSWRGTLARLVQEWLADAKHVRENYLIGHGSQSYGSVLRRELKGLESVVVLGSGQFVDELLPWIAKEHVRVTVVARNKKRLLEIQAARPAIDVSFLNHYQPIPQGRQALVVAVPMAARDLLALWGDSFAHFNRVIDLRGESVADPLEVESDVISLHHVFSHVRATTHVLEQKAKQARLRIEEMMREKRSRVDNRPFGWDDLCA